MIGQTFGLTYGAGVIIQITEEEGIPQNKFWSDESGEVKTGREP